MQYINEQTFRFARQDPCLRAVSAVGEVFPFTTTANASVCLSTLTDTQVRKRVSVEWEHLGVTGDMEAFLEQLQPVRRTGLAYDLGEHTLGLSAMGCAFKDRLARPWDEACWQRD